MVLTNEQDHPSRWAAIQPVAAKIGCTLETLSSGLYKMEIDQLKHWVDKCSALITAEGLERIEARLKA